MIKFLINILSLVSLWFIFFPSVQVRIPTSYDKPGTSQLAQSAQVNTQGIQKEVVEMWDTFAPEQGH